jgi:pimeloyl-ACP methyl ester carboxylesterase
MKITQQIAIAYIRAKLTATSLFSTQKAAQQALKLFLTPQTKAIQKELPHNAAQVLLQVGNITVHGYRWNYPKQKRILILHGFNSAAHKFEGYVKPLVNAGYEVMAFDAPAHGRSSGKSTNVIEYGSMIKAIIKEYGHIHGFIAHSFGGLALSLVLEHMPETANSKIVFIAPATETTSAIDNMFALLRFNNKKVRTAFDELIYTIGGKHPAWFSVRRAVKNIQSPVLWVHDEEDSITPFADAVKVKEDNNPHIHFMFTKGLGHNKIYHDAAVKKAVVSFM